ncbi:UdgX family uracil-DNA binding protein [Actinophytocola oryzae]|uniref:Type-4 uracil-DNA glycosylase n=1 Tax=Actinophytocola oryzae TaxID=502181 RepID=A0A4R7VFK8_9PSEU|nr:UdgX family uracil-DNA binding protein [Actinophytocola oryzae]TDV48026.1 DNA polymerase [Actinophytocola oryzae]
MPDRGGDPEIQDLSLPELRRAAAGCERCDLYRDATQTVFGKGPAPARLMMVGEQPGDQEDRAGEPFVGPAGRLLDRALADAGIDRAQVYVTNAVKHFRFTERGKRRIHQKPNRTEAVACRPWLLGELARVAPELVVCLGAVAAQSLLGSSFRLTRHRGEVMDLPGSTAKVTATVHPSAVLRAPDRDEAYEGLVADLTAARGVMA